MCNIEHVFFLFFPFLPCVELNVNHSVAVCFYKQAMYALRLKKCPFTDNKLQPNQTEPKHQIGAAFVGNVVPS